MTKSTRNRILWIAAGVLALVLILFRVELNPQLAWPALVQQPDAEREARFARCVEERDAEIHRDAFGTIDNPDVQREFITSNRQRARRECREAFPEMMHEVERPFRFNLIDLELRW